MAILRMVHLENLLHSSTRVGCNSDLACASSNANPMGVPGSAGPAFPMSQSFNPCLNVDSNRKDVTMIGILRLTAFVFLLGVVASICSAQTFSLENSEFAANLGPRGLVSLQNKGSGETVHLQNDEFSLEIDQDSFTSTDSTPVIKQENGVIAYYYERDGYSLKVKYELRPGWRFLTKQV